MGPIVSNAGPLIHLARVGKFELLRALFSSIHIAAAVYHEAVVVGEGKPGAEEVKGGLSAGWIERHEVEEGPLLRTLLVDLHRGEAETLALASSLRADLVLMDEAKGAALAQGMGIKKIGTIGILLLAKAKGLEVEVKALLDQLRRRGFRLKDELYEEILRVHGSPPQGKDR